MATAPALSTALIAARRLAANIASIAHADQGTGNSTIEVFDGPDQTGVRLFVCVLDKPCGEIVGGRIRLIQADDEGDFVDYDGMPASARWLDGNGVQIMTCTASGLLGDGHFKFESRTGGSLYAGGRVLLADDGLMG